VSEKASYWETITLARTSRRRALAAAGASTVAAALLAACGGGQDNSGETKDKSSLVTPFADTTKQAKRGGILKDRTFSDAPSLSTTTGAGNFLNPMSGKTYNTLLRTKPGYMKAQDNSVLEGSLLESFEWAPDGSQVVMKLRQSVKWHNKPPVNARSLDVDDVLLTWERFTRLNTARAEVVNALNPNAPVLSFTATDSRTLVLKLKEPVIYVLNYFSKPNASGGLNIAPKETDTGWDARGDMIGTGPFVLTNYTPSAGFTFKRNPDYWDKDEALVEQIDLPIIPEYATALAQFKAGNIYSMGNNGSPQVSQDDILSVKRDEPRILIYEDDLKAFLEARILSFGWLPEGKGPFMDERIRQAVSMSWDRDLYLETFHNVSRLGSEGLHVETFWNSHVVAVEQGMWLDPKGKDFGPNAKYFKHDLVEAKKLLAAAGYPSGMQNVPASQVAGPELPTAKHAEVINGFISELGITSKVNLIDYVKEYQGKYRNGKGQFEGWLYGTDLGGGAGDVISGLANNYWSKGATAAFRGFSASGKNDQAGDPQLDVLIEKARVERDTQKLRAVVFDIQRYLAKTMYLIQPPGAANGFTMAWPCLGNFRVVRRESQYTVDHLWVDDTKPPFKA
jgi:peptide/nickel transport system substrate-binding protein